MTACSISWLPSSARSISGSRRRSLTRATQSPAITRTNGRADTMVMFFSPVSATTRHRRAPAMSITAATAPVSTPQKITVRRRRLDRAALGQRAHDDRGGVRAGHEEDADEDHDQDRGDAGQRVLVEQLEQRPVEVDRGPPPWTTRSSAVVAVAAARAGRRWPRRRRSRTTPGVTMLGTSSTPVTNWRMVRPRADPGDEHADERRPRDPPGPVEDRPAGEPLGHRVAAAGVGARGHLGQVAAVGADGGRAPGPGSGPSGRARTRRAPGRSPAPC